MGTRNAGQRVAWTQTKALHITIYYANKCNDILFIIVFKDLVCERRMIHCIFVDVAQKRRRFPSAANGLYPGGLIYMHLDSPMVYTRRPDGNMKGRPKGRWDPGQSHAHNFVLCPEMFDILFIIASKDLVCQRRMIQRVFVDVAHKRRRAPLVCL
jgi:hypothetical protein